VILIYLFPSQLKVISRRIVINHKSGLLKQEVIETITIYNRGLSSIKEIILEMENFRNELNVFDDIGHLIPFLTKAALKTKLTEDMVLQLESDKIFLAGVAFPSYCEIEPNAYKILVLRYTNFNVKNNVSYNSPLPFYKISAFYFIFSFFGEETISLSLDFEEGITHDNGLIIIPKDENGNYLDDYSIEDNFHYKLNQHNITLSVSNRKRMEKGIQSVYALYAVVPDSEYRTLIGGITWFSLIFPIFIVSFYFHFNSLSLFGIMSTTELLSIVSMGIARFPSMLISIRKRLVISMLELFAVFVIILIPHAWISYLWVVISHFV
jgi:hypothetical protein